MADFNTLFQAKEFDNRKLILTAQDAIHEFDGTTWTDITGTAVDDGKDERWTGGWLTGAVTLANQLVVRTYKPGVDAATVPMQYDPDTGDTWEDKSYTAEVFRPFRSYMLAGNVTWDGARYPSRVQWCHPVEPGQVPDDWTPGDEDRSGDVDLADTPGAIVDMAVLRDSLLIYKRDAIHACNWVGGNDVFSFSRITSNKGIHARDCIVEYNGLHFCQGIEDIFVCDGNTTRSLAADKIKKTWLADRDEDKAQYGFTALDSVNEEILFAYVSSNAPAEYTYPDKMLVFSVRNNAFFFRDYGLEMPYASIGLDVVNQTSANLVFYGIDRTSARLLDLEAAPDRLGAPVQAYFTRTGLFSEPGHDWTQVDRAKLNITGSDAKLKLGEQIAVDAPLIWRDQFDIDPVTDYKTDNRANGNLIAYRVDISTLTPWQISNLNLLVQKTGERG
jgi:hypothetical protein